MQKFMTTLFLMTFLSVPAYADDVDSSVENAIEDIWGGEGDKGHKGHKGDKGQGRPENPGEQGRENAAQKQQENPGKGSKGGDTDKSWLEEIRDDIDGEDAIHKKNNQKQNQKPKNK